MITKISGQIVDLENEVIYPGEISFGDKIVEIKKVDKAENIFIMPGFVDAHIHIESSMLVPSRFAQLAATHGTVAAVCDPHEIANVLGIRGIDYMVRDGNHSPFKFCWTVPSCVPASEFDSAGYKLGAKEVKKLLGRKSFVGLSEVMNYPGVINKDEEVMAKIAAAKAMGKPIDGHAPLLKGLDLKKYVDAGISTDHESISGEEAEEKIKLGMKIWAREGSAAKNLEALIPIIKKYPEACGLCSDDLHPNDLLSGHINRLVKRLLKSGMDLFSVLRLSSYNIIKHYNLPVGYLRKGDPADFIVVNNLDDLEILQTWTGGKMIAKNNKALFKPKPKKIKNNFKFKAIKKADIRILASKGKPGIKCKKLVIGVMDKQLVTKKIKQELKIDSTGNIAADTANDILKIVVANRYGTNRTGVGFVNGFGIKQGAIAQSIAHDSHNIIAVGADDEDLVAAINEIGKIKGGILFFNKKIQNRINLTIGGIMTTRHGKVIAKKYRQLKKNVAKSGTKLTDPYMTLSFMALLVIPELKISDRGMFDVSKWDWVVDDC